MLFYLRFKKIDKLVLKYFFKYFTTSLTLFISIFFLFSFLQIINDKDIAKGFSPFLLTKAIIYLIPSVLSNSIIFASIFSAFFTVGEMSLSGEIIATRCCGYSYTQIVSKLAIFILIFLPFLLYLNHNITPSYRLKSRNYVRAMMNKTTNINIKSNAFEKISSYTLITEEADKSHLGKVNIIKDFSKNIDNSKKADFIINIESRNGTFKIIKESGIILSLNDGKIHYINKQNPDIFYTGSFENYLTFIPFETMQKSYTINPKFLKTKELNKLLKENYDKKIINEIFSRTINSISFFLITIFAFFIAFIFEKESKYFSFIASIGIILLYYGIEILVESFIINKINLVQIRFVTPIILSMMIIFVYYFYLRKK